MKTKQTANELIIQETPGCLWFFGLFFATIGGIFVYGALGGFTNWSEVPFWQNMLAFFMGSAGVGTGIWIIHQAPITKVIIDRIDDKVLMKRNGIFSKSETVYRFDEIKQFCLIEEKDDENSPIWSVGMSLTNGETIKITSLASHYEEYERKYVFETNEFMRKQIPTYTNDLLG